MRYSIFILSLALASFSLPQAFAQSWSTYANARYGATAEVPPGFDPAGPEANNSDGLIFRSQNGGYLTIYGADVPGRDFEAFVAKTIANELSYNGFPVTGSKIVGDVAEYWGARGPQKLRTRILSTCDGRQVVVTRFVFTANLASAADRIESSLTAGHANSC